MARRASNGKDATTYRPIIDWVVQDLKLTQAVIKYRFSEHFTFGGMHTFKRSTWHLIEINSYQRDKFIRFNIAHELRHAWQTVNKKLTTQYDYEWYKVWNGTERVAVSHCNALFGNGSAVAVNEAYRELPWEKDANDYANRVLKDLILIPTRS